MKSSAINFGKLLVIVVVAATLIALASCTSAPTPTPAPAPSPSPTPAPTPGRSVTINLSVDNVAFDKSTITVPAGANVTVIFNNKQSIPHNLAVYKTKAATEAIFVGEVIQGPKTINYQFTAPATPGTYFFRCDVHPSVMTGDLIVTGTGS